MSSPKRRKVSNDDTTTTVITPTVIPSAVLSTTSNNNNNNNPTAVVSVEPKLDELPKLILVDLQKNDPYEVLEALRTLFNRMPTTDEGVKTDEGKKIANELLLCGAPATLVLTMQKWKENEKIQAACCACIAQLVIDFKFDASKRAIILCGGVEAIVSALKAFPNSINVQTNGLSALMNIDSLLDQLSSPTIESARRFVNELDGLQLVQKAMKKFPEDPDLQEVSCGLLCNLSLRNEFHKSFIKSKLVSCVATALENHSEEENLKKWSKLFMRDLYDSDSDEEE